MLTKKIEHIQKYLKDNSIDGYLVLMQDEHGSEYTPAHFKSIAAISGFTGSAGFLLIMQDESLLWTDGRYFLQAEEQLKESNTKLMKIGEDTPLIEYISANTKRIAFDFKTANVSFIKSLLMKNDKLELIDNSKIIDEVFDNRPPLPKDKIYMLPKESWSLSIDAKLNSTLDATKDDKNFGVLVCDLADIAYLLNSRGKDIRYNPIFTSYLFLQNVKGQRKYYLFIDKKKVKKNLVNSFKEFNITIKEYDDVYKYIDNFKYKIYYDSKKTNYKIYSLLHKGSDGTLYPTLAKAIKTPKEIKQTKEAHVKDGIAMCKFLYYVKKNVRSGKLDELNLAEHLAKLRRRLGAFDLSFGTICGYMSNGAIIHYGATEKTNKKVEKKGLLLVDSGGQYYYGTTDITRTIAVGPVDEDMKYHFTLVLKAHIALASAVFKNTTTDKELDVIARKPIKDAGLNYNHGTGHGVGHLLNVHEGPQSISENKMIPVVMQEGMITSDEPGLYFEGKYGIRHENEILCVKKGKDKLGFETITYVPFDTDAIDASMLTKKEKQWLNQYHKMVYHKVAEGLNNEERSWLLKYTKEIWYDSDKL